MKVLVLNAGSSSQKSCLYEIPTTGCPIEAPSPLWEAQIDWGTTAQVQIKTAGGQTCQMNLPTTDRTTVMQQVLQTLWTEPMQVLATIADIDLVGHRIVHGGSQFQQPVRIDAAVKAAISQLIPIAPNHNRANLEGIELIEILLGHHVPQVAVFDTAFHSQLPAAAQTYPGPHDWLKQGIKRYGFHGISHAYCADRAAQFLNRDLADLQLITGHLGNGCSLAAIRDGHSVDTTMGFSPLEGLMMGTRSGSIDPSVIFYLMREQHYDGTMIDRLLNKESGLKGLSGVSHDIRQIQAAMVAGNSQAQLAWEVYIHRIRTGIGAMLMSLDRLDALIFTGGVGENCTDLRSQVCQNLSFLGLQLDEEQNRQGKGDRDIALSQSPIRILVLHTQEAWQIAKASSCLVAGD
ncbi:MAG: acetate kinase [Synechococcales bacterium]|nr:acetate kinase [Synechococcales bacterium]